MSNVLEMINEEGAMLDLKALSSSSGISRAGELDGVALGGTKKYQLWIFNGCPI